jgi:serine/threonine protein kinase
MEPRIDSVLDVGAVVGETYRIAGLIGRGGMGAVWAAEHLRLPGKHVAVKVLLDPAAGGEEMFQRFRREAEIASRLGHPNIVEVLDFNTLPTGQPYIVLEYLQGETLATRLAAGRILLNEALTIARQIGSALQAAHRAGVVHRDLKPDNVFLCTPEEDMPTRVKVLDFGISKIRGSQTLRTQDAVLMGTPQYMSPEQATGKNTEVDGRTDVFALGAIVYEMLGGQAAFAGGSLAEVVYRVVHGQPTPLRELAPALPDEVVAAVEHALQKEPAARPAEVGTFILELTGRPLHAFTTGNAVGMAATQLTPRSGGARSQPGLEPTHTPSPRVPTAPWPPPHADLWQPVQSGAVTAPPPSAEPALRRVWPLVAVGGLALLAGAALLGLRLMTPRPPGGTAALAPPTPALAPLEPMRPLPPPPPISEVLPPKPPGADTLPAERPPPHDRTGHLKHPLREQKKGLDPAHSRLVAKSATVAEPPPAAEPPPPPALPPDGIRPEVRKLLEQAEDALQKNKPLDAARLVDQSFFIEKTALGYAIQVRAACQRRDVGSARAAFRNLNDPELRRTAVRACLRQEVWLF